MEKINFKDFKNSIRAFRILYEDILRSFSCYELHEKVKFVYRVKNTIYSLEFSIKRKDAIWEYLNYDITYDDLQKIK